MLFNAPPSDADAPYLHPLPTGSYHPGLVKAATYVTCKSQDMRDAPLSASSLAHVHFGKCQSRTDFGKTVSLKATRQFLGHPVVSIAVLMQ
jgi:hypothetical protein